MPFDFLLFAAQSFRHLSTQRVQLQPYSCWFSHHLFDSTNLPQVANTSRRVRNQQQTCSPDFANLSRKYISGCEHRRLQEQKMGLEFSPITQTSFIASALPSFNGGCPSSSILMNTWVVIKALRCPTRVWESGLETNGKGNAY